MATVCAHFGIASCFTEVTLVAFFATMKFGKECEERFARLGLDLPPFPYKAAKKKLKEVDGKSTSVEPAAHAGEEFLLFLERNLRMLDAEWSHAARVVIRAEVAPIKAAALAFISVSRQSKADATMLAAWARLSREALRKILKKANKQLGTSYTFDTLPPLALICSRTRTEIEHLATHDEAEPVHDCPVCLDLLFEPVAPACGHALCNACFQSLRSSQNRPRCPVCRRPAGVPQRMHVVAAAAKAADPVRHTERKAQDEYEKAEALAKRYAKQIKRMPMQRWA